MATITLILGESGTGKTASLRNLDPKSFAYVNVTGKPLPFKSTGVEQIAKTTNFRKIADFIKETKKKIIVIDDCQYIMSFQYMRRITETGWDKFNEIQSDFFNLIDLCNDLPDDVTVYFLSHLETKDDGRQKIKTIGKMLDEKITIEGIFTTVLKTHVSDSQYFFLTQNSGNDTVKSPLGMFPALAIDNDLKYVDDKIRNYYEIGEHKSDEEMEEEDAKVKKPDVDKSGKVKRKGRNAKKQEEMQKQLDDLEVFAKDPDPEPESEQIEFPFDADDGPGPQMNPVTGEVMDDGCEKLVRKTRKRRTEQL